MIKTIGIIGLGSIGLRHAKNCLEKNIIVYGFDVSKERNNHARKFGIKITTKEALLEKTNNFIICTPSSMHHEDLKYVLKNGKKILVEKPFTHNYLATKRMLKKINNQRIYTAFNLRFHSIVKKIKEILNKNLLGKVIWSSSIVCSDLRLWRPGSDIKKNYTNDSLSGGVINDYSHEIDLINFFFGKTKKVVSFMNNSRTLGLNVNDYASITMQNKNNVFSNIKMDYCSGPSIRKGIIRGIKASIFYDLLNRKIKIINSDGEVILEESHNTSFDFDYKEEIESFAKTSNRNLNLASMDDGLEVSRIINYIYKKNKKI